jgi:hypothetical protein
MSKHYVFLAGIVVACTIFACGAQGQSELKLSSLSPSSGPIGMVVLLQGSGFTDTSNTIHFGLGGQKDLKSSNGGTQISYTIPGGVGRCDLIGPSCMAPTRQVTPGQYPIYVTNARGRSETLMFEVTK